SSRERLAEGHESRLRLPRSRLSHLLCRILDGEPDPPQRKSSCEPEATMSEKNLEAHFLHNLKDIYFAEQQIAKALPAMIAAAESDELRSAFETHARETQHQIRRLEQIFEIVGERPAGIPCEGILGIIKEGHEMMRGVTE